MKLNELEVPELDKKVAQLPHFTLRNIYVAAEDGRMVPSERFLGVVNEDTVYACVSRKYVLVQFKDLFTEITKKFPDGVGNVFYHNGSAVLSLMPDANATTGIYVYNSVNKSASIFIRFLVRMPNGGVAVVPGMKQFKQVHIGKQIEIKIDNFATFLKNVESEWATIVGTLQKTQVDKELLEAVLLRSGLNKTFRDLVRQHYIIENRIHNCWDLFVDMISILNAEMVVKPKSDVRRFRILEHISDSLHSIAIATKI